MAEVAVDPNETEMIPSLEEIMRWKKTKMTEWLDAHQMPRSGNKDILAARILRKMRVDSSDDSDSDSDTSTTEPEHDLPDPESLTCGWETVDENSISVLEDKDIENYFVHHKCPTSGSFHNFQRQLVKSKKLANENHVASLHYHPVSVESRVIYVKGKCFPTMRQKVPVSSGGIVCMVDQYSQYITLSKSSSFVVNAKCNCKAGAAGLCAHVGACLIVLSRITKPACTSSACSWSKPNMKSAPQPRHWQDIAFVNTESRTTEDVRAQKPLPGVYQAGPCSDADQFLAEMLRGLADVNPTCVLFSTLCSKREDISDFMALFNVEFSYRDTIDLKSDQVQSAVSAFVQNLEQGVSAELCANVNQATVGQHNNRNWQTARSVIVTSSNFGSVCKMRPETAPDNNVKLQRGYCVLPEGLRSISYGRRNELKARKLYAQHHAKQCNVPVQVRDAGLQVHSQIPYLGSSVDGVVECPKCGSGVVEIKCPYGTKKNKWRKMSVEQCCRDPKFCCEISECNVTLKTNHSYYYQVMGQLAITNSKYCDFVVYTKKGINVERMSFDEDVWSAMVVKLRSFYRHVVAELMSSRIMRGKSLYNVHD